MKFITELELRELYRRDPFTTYTLEPDTRITPGARQFLVDRRVKLLEAQLNNEEDLTHNGLSQVQVRKTWPSQRLLKRMERIESQFLLMASELLHSGNAILSEEVMALGRCFQKVRRAEQDQTTPPDIQFWGWSEAELQEHSADLEEYVDICEFHLELKNSSREVSLLNYLRASLHELEPLIEETYWIEEKLVCSRQDLIDSVNLMIKILSMMVWKCLGGKHGRSKIDLSIL